MEGWLDGDGKEGTFQAQLKCGIDVGGDTALNRLGGKP